MNMFARFEENPSMTLKVLRKQNVTDARTNGQRENSIPHTKFAGGIIIILTGVMEWASKYVSASGSISIIAGHLKD